MWISSNSIDDPREMEYTYHLTDAQLEEESLLASIPDELPEETLLFGWLEEEDVDALAAVVGILEPQEPRRLLSLWLEQLGVGEQMSEHDRRMLETCLLAA